FAAEIANTRNQISEIETAFSKVERAPAPAADLKARAFAEIDAIATTGEITVYPTTRGSSPINLKRRFELSAHPSGRETNPVSILGDAGAPFFVWLMQKEIKEKIGALIDALPQAETMEDVEREQAFAELAVTRLYLERIEEHLISTAEAQGRIITRRVDADPRAILLIDA